MRIKVPTELWLEQDTIGLLRIGVFRTYAHKSTYHTISIENASLASLNRLIAVMESGKLCIGRGSKKVYYKYESTN